MLVISTHARYIRRFGCLLCFFGALLAHGKILTVSARGQSSKIKPQQASSDQPLWRVDLQPMGYPPGETAPQGRRNPLIFRTIDFLSDSVLVATFVTREPDADLPRRDDPNRPRRDLFHAIFLDAATGKLLKTMEWPTDDKGAGIFPRYDGGFLFFSTERLVLYSPEWTPVKELVLPQLLAPHATLTGISESPSGRALEVRIEGERSVVCLRIQTATLDGVQEPCITRIGRFSISDDAMAQSDVNDAIEVFDKAMSGKSKPRSGGPLLKTKIMIREGSADARLLCDPNQTSNCNNPQFTDNQTIVVYGITGLSVLTRRGESKDQQFEKVFTSDQTWLDLWGGMIRPSSNGQRFAVVFAEPPTLPETSSIHFSMILPPDHIDVYDVPAGGFLYSLKNRRKQFKNIFGTGLSPNGEKLVIDSGGVIQVYPLPSAAESRTLGH